MSLEVVVVKEEPEWENSASECGVSEAAARAGLYAGHAVKDELVLGPECLQPPGVTYALDVVPQEIVVKSEHKPVLRECSVRLERLTDTRQTSHHDSSESSSSMCAQQETDVRREQYHTGISTQGASCRCDICGERFILRAHLAKHVAVHIHVEDNESGSVNTACVVTSAERVVRAQVSACSPEQHTTRECSVRLERLPGHGAPPSTCPTSPSTVRHRPRADSPLPPPDDPHTHQHRTPHTHTYECDTCGKTYIYKQRLIRHVQRHRQDRSTSSSKKSKINFQKDIPIKKQTFFCDQCGKRFPRLAALKVHTRIHTGEKAFSCELCKKRFARSDHLNDHNRMHADEKRYICEVCGKRFTLLDYLRKHKLVHGEKRNQGIQGKPFSCEICGKQFNLLWHVRRHKVCHIGEKPFTCEICKRQFARSEHFKRHKLIHTGEKPFECEECHKKFRELHHLMRHKTIHTGDKSHMCDICKKMFSDVGNLKQHRRVHTGEKPHTCTICGKQFVRLDTFRAHTRSHTDEK